MTKKWVLAVALLSLAISMGCRNVTGVSQVNVAVSDPGNVTVLYVTQVVQFTATVTGTSNTAVTWSLSGDVPCTGNPSPCGTLDSSGKYTAPATSPGSSVNINITATSQADSRASDSMSVKVHQITVQITPNSPNVGVNLTQQFVAVAVPDDAPQTFTWSQPTCTTAPCGTISVPDPNNTALAVYAAPGSPSPANDVKFIATSTVDTTGFTQATVTVVKSRLLANSTYAFRFSGFNNLGATARAGSFVVAADGATISSGVADELTTGGPQHCPTVTGSYSPASNDSNNQGTVILNLCGASNTYTAVLDANGDIQVIESDSKGTGSGVIEPFTGKFPGNASLSGPFVFGFTGVDSADKRVGHVGVVNMDGSGGISSGGLMDTNDNGNAGSASDLTGSYSMVNGVGTMSLTSSTLGKSFSFNLYGVSGQLTGKNPATLYAINTDPIGNNSAVSGTVVFQDPAGSPYNTGTFKKGNTSVVSLTGVDSTGTNSNVSLTLVTTDGAGNLSGNFDQNNAGTIVSVSNFSTGYTYLATGSGRYTFKLLGNPNAPVVPPLPFVLYASAANQGFLLDQSSPSVMTGTMVLQTIPKAQQGFFSASNIPGTYAAATTSSATSGVDPIAANLLLTWVGTGTCTAQCVNGTQYDAGNPGGVPVAGPNKAYTLQGSGYGTITLTAPSAESYVIYAIDITHLLVMDVDKTNANASIIFAEQ